MQKFRISVVLTNRTNYSKLKLILRMLRIHEDVELSVAASSSLLLEKYGAAYRDLEKDGVAINEFIDCLMMNDSHESMANTIGLSVLKHSTYFSKFKPSLVIIVGDRFDTLAIAMTAMVMNIPIAHIQGGEESGTIDDRVRNLISIGSELHFVATEKSASRLTNMGISPTKIFNFGCPAVEYIESLDVGGAFDGSRIGKTFKREIQIGQGDRYFLVMVHPDTTNSKDVSMREILSAVEEFNTKAFVFYPNVDANNSLLLEELTAFRENENFYMIRHMPLDGFVHIMAHADCMIGNSSSGIREAASFETPVVNIGERQKGRERNSNTTDVECNKTKIMEAISDSISKKNIYPNKNIYSTKNGSKLIVDKIMNFLDN
ncbi:UDP-N-acetylglucosamine 2-epimerase [Gammaproteobacteria bacterium]|nr:UDP-N-acetylglucosamine 2-epimerase [Gammaproteobacteria bacterium]